MPGGDALWFHPDLSGSRYPGSAPSVAGQPLNPLGTAALPPRRPRRFDLQPFSADAGHGAQMLVGSLGLLAVSGLLGEWARFDVTATDFAALPNPGRLLRLRMAAAPCARVIVVTYAYVNPAVAVLWGGRLAGVPLRLQSPPAHYCRLGFLINTLAPKAPVPV